MGGKQSSHTGDLEEEDVDGHKVIRVNSAGSKKKKKDKEPKVKEKGKQKKNMQSVGLFDRMDMDGQVGAVEETTMPNFRMAMRSSTTLSSTSSGQPESHITTDRSRRTSGFISPETEASRGRTHANVIRRKRGKSLQRNEKNRFSQGKELHHSVVAGDTNAMYSDEDGDDDDVPLEAHSSGISSTWTTSHLTSDESDSDPSNSSSADSLNELFDNSLFLDHRDQNTRKGVLSPTSEAKSKLVKAQNGTFIPVLELSEELMQNMSDQVVITEYSFMDDVQRVESMPLLESVDLEVVGHAMTIYTGSDDVDDGHINTTEILQELRKANLIATTRGNISRENTLIDLPQIHPKQPMRLAKLNYKKEKKKLNKVNNEMKGCVSTTSDYNTDPDDEWQVSVQFEFPINLYVCRLGFVSLGNLYTLLFYFQIISGSLY